MPRRKDGKKPGWVAYFDQAGNLLPWDGEAFERPIEGPCVGYDYCYCVTDNECKMGLCSKRSVMVTFDEKPEGRWSWFREADKKWVSSDTVRDPLQVVEADIVLFGRLKFNDCERGRSAAIFWLTLDFPGVTAKYPMRMTETLEMLKKANITNGGVSGIFGIVKQGANYSLTFIDDGNNYKMYPKAQCFVDFCKVRDENG